MSRTAERDPVIVVGSGIAGSLLALEAAEHGPVVVVSEGATALGTATPSSGGATASGLFNTWTRVPAGTSL